MNQMNKEIYTLREEIESRLNDMLEHYSRQDESFSEYPDAELTTKSLLTLFQKVVDKVVGQKDIGNSNHGNCCTCQTCKHWHDECMCRENELKDQIRASFKDIVSGKIEL